MKPDQPGVNARQRRWIIVGLAAWVLIGTLAGQFREPPFDLVRFLVRLVLGGLTAWFFAWLFTRLSFLRRND